MILISSLDVEQRREYLLAIEDAIVSAVDYISFNGQQVKFRSLDEMFRIRSFLRDSLGMTQRSREAYRGPRVARINSLSYRL